MDNKNMLGEPKHLAHTTLPDMVAREIVNYLKTHDIHCGQVLPSEKQFSDYFGVGRASIREGIARLKSLGLVDTVQGYGVVLNEVTMDSYFETLLVSDLAYFVSLTKQEMAEIISARMSIEIESCRKYFESGTEDELIPLKKALDNMAVAEAEGNDRNYNKYDREFHSAIVKLGKNKVQSYIFSILRIPCLREMEMLLTPENLVKIDAMHEGIYQSLKEKNPDIYSKIEKHFEYYFNDSPILN